MKRKYRVAVTAAATAGLITGAAAALAAVPGGPPSTTPSRLPVVVDSAAAQRAELVRLQAELAGSGGRSARLRAQIARLQKDIERARAALTPSAPPVSVGGSPTAVRTGASHPATQSRLAPSSSTQPRPAPSTLTTTDDDGPGEHDG